MRDMTSVTGFNTDGFSVARTLGGFINNREFSRGFVDFTQGIPSPEAYVWTCLSACADDIGDAVYSNVRNYVDFVSNVETCKIQALRSMMKELGFDYTIFDNIELVPREVLDLMHVMSIDRKYLLNSTYLKENLKADLSAYGAIRSVPLADTSAYFSVQDMTDAQKAQMLSTCETVDEQKYFEYTCGLFEELLSGFCSMRYLQEPDGPDNPYLIYKTLDIGTFGDALTDSDIQFKTFKKQHNIPVSFDQAAIVDDIENGRDTLDAYQYPYSDLLSLEMGNRAAKVSVAELKAASGTGTISACTKDESLRNETRYSYYRKERVKEYVNFIDNKYFEDYGGVSSDFYDLDSKYIRYGGIDQHAISVGDTGEKALNGDVIRKVAKSLAVTTQYVNRLREKLKLQTRKNYMKGTQNLLLYVINEYLIDYSRHLARIAEAGGSAESLSDVIAGLSAHSIDAIDVIEYYDDTEYFNISAGTSTKAIGADSVNDRFWLASGISSDGKSIAAADIAKFYLQTMATGDVLSSEQMMGEFLDAVFQVGADESYIDSATSAFVTKLSAFGRYSDDVYAEHQMLSAAFDGYISYKPDGYEHGQTPISDQVLTVFDAVSADLIEKYTAGVSSVYEKYSPSVDGLMTTLTGISSDFDKMISGDNATYFVSSDCKYCFEEDGYTGQKTYKHDYYVGNPRYQDDDGYLVTKLNSLRQYMTGVWPEPDGMSNITNFPVVDTVSAVYTACNDLSSEWTGGIASELAEYGFVDMNSPTLDQEFQQGYDFVKEKLDRRLTFLQEQLNQVRTEANQLKSQYQNVQMNFASVVAGYDDGTSELDLHVTEIYAISRKKFESSWFHGKDNVTNNVSDGFCSLGSSGTVTKKDLEWIQYNVDLDKYAFRLTGDYYKDDNKSEKGSYGYICTNLGSGYVDNDPLEKRVDQFITFMDAPTSFDYYKETDDDKNVTYDLLDSQIYRGLKKEGAYAAATQCLENIQTMEDQTTSVKNQVNDIGGDLELTEDKLEDRINRIVEYVTTEFSEANFENDSTVKAYRAMLVRINEISARYVPYRDDYLALYGSDQAAYLGEFSHTNDLTFEVLSGLLIYSAQKDQTARESMLVWHDGMLDRMDALETDYKSIASELQLLEYDYYMPGKEYQPYYDAYQGIIEESISDMSAFLTTDLELKEADAYEKAEYELRIFAGHLDIVSAEISSRMGETVDMDEAVVDRLNELDIYQDQQYLSKRDMFLTYAGQDGCRYPYYNMSNKTHSSYQTHPYLWNFVSKEDATLNELIKSFYRLDTQDFDSTKFSRNIDIYYGKFGQAVNEWLNPDILDYSGYITRYERSSHVSDKSQLSSEVVDFDGAFYPPAVNELFRYVNADGSLLKCVRSIRDGAYFSDRSSPTVRAMISSLPVDLTECIHITENYNRNTARISSWSYVEDISVYNTLRDIVEPYCISAGLSDRIDRYFRANLTEAQEISVTRLALVESVLSGIEPTFYDRFYRHLNYQNNPVERAYLADQLSVQFQQMSSTVLSAHPIADRYDIYRYGLDQNGNSYSLFKRYGSEKPTYFDKKNTPGQLWIRLNDHPFAFPAFNGQYPNTAISSYSNIPEPIRQLAGISSEQQYGGYISSDMSCFYDFEISKNGKYLFLISDRRGNGISQDRGVHMYENPWIVNCATSYAKDDRTLIDVMHSSVSASETTMVIRSGEDVERESALSGMPVEDRSITAYAFVGPYIKNNITTNFVYAEKTYDRISGDDGDVELSARLTGKVKILQLMNGKYQPDDDITGDNMFHKAWSDDVCFAYDGDGKLTFAYVEKNSSGKVQSGYGSRVNLSANINGELFSDPRYTEMNSHDVFDLDVVVQKKVVRGGKLQMDTKASTEQNGQFNQNADMSYVPCYPGVSGETVLYDNGVDATADRIWFQLLGRSKNIDGYISQVNKDVDPYFDLSSVSSNYLFGRVYEDWQEYANKDNTFRLFENDTLNDRHGLSEDLSGFVWEIPLSVYGYERYQKDSLRIIIYNTETLGKNPYMVGMFGSLSSPDGKWFDLGNYDDEPNTGNTGEFKVDTTLSGSDVAVTVTGTYGGDRSRGLMDCNHIDNVSGISAAYTSEADTLRVLFGMKDAHVNSFVKKGQVNVLLYNPNDLRMFEYFHYLDAYGAVNALDGRSGIPDDRIFQNGQVSFVYDRNKYSASAVSAAVKAYYNDAFGCRRFLDDIHLSDYSCLSDVYVLNGSRGMQFKYSEEDVFPFDSQHYYYPTLNVRYPKSMGDFPASPSCMLQNQAREYNMSKVFGQDNLYIFDVSDPSQISSRLGQVEISVSYDDIDCIRCFEPYTEFISTEWKPAGNVSSLFGKFDIADSRTMQYVKYDELYTCDEQHNDESVLLSSISSAFEDCHKTSDFADLVSELSVMPRYQEKCETTRHEQVSFGINGVDLSPLMKLYVNYAKKENGITLYFNYFNLLDTPYVRIDGNKTYPAYIDGTYLALKPGESGNVSIVAQLRYYVNGKPYGLKNAKLATYAINNVSDDKPKFLITETERITPGDLLIGAMAPNVEIAISETVIDTAGFVENDRIPTFVRFSIQSDAELSAPYTVGLDYPFDLVEIEPEDVSYGAYVRDTRGGYAEIVVVNNAADCLSVGFTTRLTARELSGMTGRYLVNADVDAVGMTGVKADVRVTPGAFEIR